MISTSFKTSIERGCTYSFFSALFRSEDDHREDAHEILEPDGKTTNITAATSTSTVQTESTQCRLESSNEKTRHTISGIFDILCIFWCSRYQCFDLICIKYECHTEGVGSKIVTSSNAIDHDIQDVTVITDPRGLDPSENHPYMTGNHTDYIHADDHLDDAYGIFEPTDHPSHFEGK